VLGHKALAVSLSDIAAMGARPTYALISLGIPQEIWKTKFVDELYEGFFALAAAHRITLIGGDVSRTPDRIVIDSIVLGEVKRRCAILRSGAKPDDHIFVTGSLGGAAAGLKLLENGSRVCGKKPRSRRAIAEQNLMLRHLKPEPQVAWGAMLGEKRLATSMIDISDGLSSDLLHLCGESGVGARIDAARIPIDPNISTLGSKDLDSLALVLNGGEDFELLFTVNPRSLKTLPAKFGQVEATYIGDMTSQSSVMLVNGSRTEPLTSAGFMHF
jgi:thiamine-monophosphate kinase